MKNEMKDIDELIKETLTREEAKFYDELGEQNIFEMIGGMFNTRHRWLIVIMNIVTLIAAVLFVFCLIEFLKADTTNDLIKWAAAGFTCMLFVTMLKIFAWMQMDKNALLREIKRLELQISSIAGKLPS
ncbi:DUF6768 family protein [Aquimarina sp. 2201CG5-10]|uniref:DUF6768 family protein n=1 Tax=Aquimarina callyspongiae TaxID=3098150 RepID=UPI002AB45BA0|nr:DUF6768 family protein [Aquimarina sp. 2201CG5-10]MDY8138969.1 DUF6768 family protein [Aquimarina sp. 2201CG5-10]